MSVSTVVIVGAGPAGLMAADVLSRHGVGVDVYDAMPSAGRKFLLAGRGGLNITHTEPREQFVSRYGAQAARVARWLDALGPQDVREWVHGLGIETFAGTSGRVFPKEMKAAPLLRSWLHVLRERGVRFHMRHRWLGWDGDSALRFATPEGETRIASRATLLALGGGSWRRLGSDGTWAPVLAGKGVSVAPLAPANCGFIAGWSMHFAERFAGQPLKSVALAVDLPDGSSQYRRGECMVTADGIEGGLVYAFSGTLRDEIQRSGHAVLHLDLLPDRDAAFVMAETTRSRGARSMSSHLRSRLGLHGVKAGLLRECLSPEEFSQPAVLARAIKRLPIRLVSTRPIDEAISTAGGVRFESLDERLMLKAMPGVFCAGEMLDWEAPTGGYLLTACLASGHVAGSHIAAWLSGAA